jgi:hypothetical protein
MVNVENILCSAAMTTINTLAINISGFTELKYDPQITLPVNSEQNVSGSMTENMFLIVQFHILSIKG